MDHDRASGGRCADVQLGFYVLLFLYVLFRVEISLGGSTLLVTMMVQLQELLISPKYMSLPQRVWFSG